MKIFRNPTDEPYFPMLMEVFLEVLVDKANIRVVGNEITNLGRETTITVLRVRTINEIGLGQGGITNSARETLVTLIQRMKLQEARLAAIGFFVKEFVLNQMSDGATLTDHEIWERALTMIADAAKGTR